MPTRSPQYQRHRLVARNPRNASPPSEPVQHALATRLAKMKPSEIETVIEAIASLQFTNSNSRLDELIGLARQCNSDWQTQKLLTERMALCTSLKSAA